MGFDFSYVWGALPTLVLAAKMNVLVTLLAFTFSLTFGTVLALLRRAELRGVTGAILVYISFIRGTPILVQIFIVYYVLPAAGIDLPPLTAGIVAIGLNSSAFVAEIMRAGINGIPKRPVRGVDRSRPGTRPAMAVGHPAAGLPHDDPPADERVHHSPQGVAHRLGDHRR